jgi:hypothetical protein
VAIGALAVWIALQTDEMVRAEAPSEACRIEVVDKENGWPVSMVQLTTTHNVKFVTDNAGRVAFDLPELIGQETFFIVFSDGYEAPADGFGFHGVRVTPKAGETVTIQVNRKSIAKRLGRVTGAGLFAESQKLGLETDWKETGVLGSDSVQNAVHNGRLFWAWGDTTLARYPLGIFDTTSATTAIRPIEKFEPPLKIKMDYFTDGSGRPRGVAKLPGSGPTWIVGCLVLPDKTGKERLVATYHKVKPPMDAYETGLCVWNDETNNFERVRVVWSKTDSKPKPPAMPLGHPVVYDDGNGEKWALFGDPLPTLKCAATFEAWQDPSKWEMLKPQETLKSAIDGKPVKPAGGTIAWNSFRKRWVTIFVEMFGAPSWMGEVWYAEADSPFGPWGTAVKVLSHKNYAYYNPQLHPEFTPADSPILLFEGTHSVTFANKPEPTPRYDYNQIMYRLDLDDAKLAPAREGSR